MADGFIQRQRIKRGMTQEHLASELGMSRPTYRQLECGEREMTISEARKLADIFDVSLIDLLEEKEPAHRVTLEKERSGGSTDLRIRVQKENLDKFRQVLFHILKEVGAKPNFGETVLHKLLYFIDFDYYEKYEESLMGATYIRNHHGPTSVELGRILQEMESRGEIEAVRSRYFKYPQKKYLPLKDLDLSALSAREIGHIDGVLARLSDKNADEMARYSHEDIPWKSAQPGKPISYESVFYRDERYSVKRYEDEI